jgi:hypothetical protein
MAFSHFFDDRPEVALLPLETGLILGDKPLEMMEQYPVEDGPLRMSRTINSRYGGRMASETGHRQGYGTSPWEDATRPGQKGRICSKMRQPELSWKTWEGGGFSATNINFRWSMIRSTTRCSGGDLFWSIYKLNVESKWNHNMSR